MNIIKPVKDYTVHGRPVAYARLRAIDDEQGIVICDLLNAADQVLAADRYFHLSTTLRQAQGKPLREPFAKAQDKPQGDGSRQALKQAPFEISSADRVALGAPHYAPGLPPSFPGEVPAGPDDSWNKSDIQAWLESQEIPFNKRDSKAALLEKIEGAMSLGVASPASPTASRGEGGGESG